MPSRKDPQSQLATRLSVLRTRAGVTQQELAAATGLSLGTIYRLETGKTRNPKIRDLANCAIALGYDLFEVVEDEWQEWSNLDGRHPAPPDPASFLRPDRWGYVDQG